MVRFGWEKYLPIALMGLGLACEGNDGRPVYPSFTQDLDELMAAEGDVSTFYDLIKATSFYPQLKSGSTFTILAPNNAAFGGVNVDMLKADPDALGTLVRFHILSGTIDSKLLDLGGEFRTISSTVVHVDSQGMGNFTIRDSHGNTARVTKPDAQGRNGILHVMDGLLEPPDEPMMMTGNLRQELMAFGSLLAALTRAGIDVGAAAGPLTVFAPSDAAFTALGNITAVNDDVIENILLHHTVAGSHPSAELMTNPTLTSQAKLPLVVAGGGATVGGATIGAMKDIMATNGIAHEVTTVIVPPTVLEYVGDAMSLDRTDEAATRAEADLMGDLAPDALMGDAPITFFAPTGMSWTTAGIDTAMANTSTLADILRRHTLATQMTIEQLTTANGMNVATLNGMVAVSVAAGVITLTDDANNTFVIDNAASDVRTLNGAVHVGTGVLTGQ